MANTQRFIVRKGTRLFLSDEDEKLLERQSRIITAQKALKHNTITRDMSDIDDEILYRIGTEIEGKCKRNLEEIRYDVLAEFGLFD